MYVPRPPQYSGLTVELAPWHAEGTQYAHQGKLFGDLWSILLLKTVLFLNENTIAKFSQ